jgi:hypothetical protein
VKVGRLRGGGSADGRFATFLQLIFERKKEDATRTTNRMGRKCDKTNPNPKQEETRIDERGGNKSSNLTSLLLCCVKWGALT